MTATDRDLSQTIDALPADLAVWHDGPTALPGLLATCSLERFRETLELLAGRDPSEFTRAPQPQLAEIKKHWAHAVATVVDWHTRFGNETASQVPVPARPGSRNKAAARRTARLRPRAVNQRDYQTAVDLAARWNELDPIRVGLRTGDMTVERSSAKHVWIENHRRADIEVLDITLEQVTVSADALDLVRDPDPITLWFTSHQRTSPVDGRRDRHPAAELLINTVPTHLRDLAWDDVEELLRRLNTTIPADTDLGGLTLAEARSCYAFLIMQLQMNEMGAFNFGAPELTQWAIRPANLLQALTQRVSTSAAQAFITMCTFQTGRSALSAPLIPHGIFLIIPAEVVSTIAFERTLLRAASSDPARAGSLGNALGRRADRWGERLRTIPGCAVAETVRVRDANGRTLGDLDVVAWDRTAQLMMIVEAKWPVDAHTLAESHKVDAMLDKAREQVIGLRRALAAGDAVVGWPPAWGAVPSETTTTWWVGSAQQLDSRPLTDGTDVHSTSLRFVEQLLPATSLQDLLTRLDQFPLPRLGVEFDLIPRTVAAGEWTIHYKALELNGPPPIPPSNKRVQDGWT